MIIDAGDGPIIVYAMQTDDLERSRAVTDESPRPVDAEHRAVMRAADDGLAAAEVVLDLRVDGRLARLRGFAGRGDDGVEDDDGAVDVACLS